MKVSFVGTVQVTLEQLPATDAAVCSERMVETIFEPNVSRGAQPIFAVVSYETIPPVKGFVKSAV